MKKKTSRMKKALVHMESARRVYFAVCILLYLIEQIKYCMGHLSIEFPNINVSLCNSGDFRPTAQFQITSITLYHKNLFPLADWLASWLDGWLLAWFVHAVVHSSHSNFHFHFNLWPNDMAPQCTLICI